MFSAKTQDNKCVWKTLSLELVSLLFKNRMKEQKKGQIAYMQIYLMVAQPHPSLAIGWARPGDAFIQRLIF